MLDLIVKLPNNSDVRIRPIQKSDVFLLEAMHSRLSQASIRLRFFGARLPALEAIYQISYLDGRDGVALVAVPVDEPGKIVGLAYYLLGDDGAAEPALLVEDAYQGQHIGSVLAEQLVIQALANGVTIFNAHIDPDNRRILRMVRASGLPYQHRVSQGVGEIRMELKPAEPQSVADLRLPLT